MIGSSTACAASLCVLRVEGFWFIIRVQILYSKPGFGGGGGGVQAVLGPVTLLATLVAYLPMAYQSVLHIIFRTTVTVIMIISAADVAMSSGTTNTVICQIKFTIIIIVFEYHEFLYGKKKFATKCKHRNQYRTP